MNVGALPAEAATSAGGSIPLGIAWGYCFFGPCICGCVPVMWAASAAGRSPFVTGVADVVDQCYTTCAVTPRICHGVSPKSTQVDTSGDSQEFATDFNPRQWWVL